MAKKIITLIVLFLPLLGYTQQDPMYSQYMFNGLAINPAYAGSRDALSAYALHRQQWVGDIDGAPVTSTFSIHSPLPNDKIAVGLNLVHDQLGVNENIYANAAGAYRIDLGKGKLSMGLQAGFINYTAEHSSVEFKDKNDPAAKADISEGLPNFGTGLFYSTNRFYAGFSVPRILHNELTNFNNATQIAELKRHYFLTSGYVMDVSENIKWKPSFLLKYIPAANPQVDINTNFLFMEKFWAGLSYRSGESISAILQYNLTKNLRIGYAYDYVTNDINTYTSGSHEIMVNYEFRFLEEGKVVSPRYF